MLRWYLLRTLHFYFDWLGPYCDKTMYTYPVNRISQSTFYHIFKTKVNKYISVFFKVTTANVINYFGLFVTHRFTNFRQIASQDTTWPLFCQNFVKIFYQLKIVSWVMKFLSNGIKIRYQNEAIIIRF